MNLEKLKYYGGDATNYQSLLEAISDVDGPICVVVEGITMYLNAKDVETLYNNVSRLLRSRPGSVFITTDPGFELSYAMTIDDVGFDVEVNGDDTSSLIVEGEGTIVVTIKDINASTEDYGKYTICYVVSEEE